MSIACQAVHRVALIPAPLSGVCRYGACVTSLCGWSILMEETAKAIAALRPAVRPRDYLLMHPTAVSLALGHDREPA